MNKVLVFEFWSAGLVEIIIFKRNFFFRFYPSKKLEKHHYTTKSKTENIIPKNISSSKLKKNNY